MAIPGQPTTALVIGTDRRKGNQAELTGRSDTLILVRADPQTKSLSMLSFPRDLIATLKCPGHPDVRDRINAAFSECGTLGAVETVRALTGLPINYFVTVNFRGFNDLVNNLGGVWLDIDHRYLCDPANCPGVSKINLLPGYQRLNASNALAYVRFRHFDSDLYRNARQQLFLKALKQQISSQLNLDTVFSIMNAVEKNVVVGRGGGKPLDPTDAQGLHLFRAPASGGACLPDEDRRLDRDERAFCGTGEHRCGRDRIRAAGRQRAVEGA